MRKVILVIALLLLVAGVSVMAYPYVQQQLFRMHARNVIADFEARLDEYRAVHAEAAGEDDPLQWLYDLTEEHNRQLFESGQQNLIDPFSYQQVDFSLEYFGFAEEMVGFITIPKMNVELPIYLGASYENLERGAAHLTQTSLPMGGRNTNSVIAAHRGMGTAAMFRDIELLDIGDEIFITNFMGTLRYEVVEIKIIFPAEVASVLIQQDRDLITLLTCHPYRRNFQRYLVFAERAD